jgi:murein DD-endopeptidase MepM/ murein hydrolase activator NlpD
MKWLGRSTAVAALAAIGLWMGGCFGGETKPPTRRVPPQPAPTLPSEQVPGTPPIVPLPVPANPDVTMPRIPGEQPGLPSRQTPAPALPKQQPPPKPKVPVKIDFAGPFRTQGRLRTEVFGKYEPEKNVFAGGRHTSAGRGYSHQGLDVAAPIGTPVIAPEDGLIVKAGAWNPSGYGRAVLVRVDTAKGPLFVLYAHLNRVQVKRGQRVSRGESIGTVGNSGSAGRLPRSESHVHIEVRTEENVYVGMAGRVDPQDYFDVTVPKELRD